MDIEQLKLILETMSAAGEGASTLVVAYLVIGLVKCFIGPGAFVVVFVIAAKLTRYIVDKYNIDPEKRLITKLEWYQEQYPMTSRNNAERVLHEVEGED